MLGRRVYRREPIGEPPGPGAKQGGGAVRGQVGESLVEGGERADRVSVETRDEGQGGIHLGERGEPFPCLRPQGGQ